MNRKDFGPWVRYEIKRGRAAISADIGWSIFRFDHMNLWIFLNRKVIVLVVGSKGCFFHFCLLVTWATDCLSLWWHSVTVLVLLLLGFWTFSSPQRKEKSGCLVGRHIHMRICFCKSRVDISQLTDNHPSFSSKCYCLSNPILHHLMLVQFSSLFHLQAWQTRLDSFRVLRAKVSWSCLDVYALIYEAVIYG